MKFLLPIVPIIPRSTINSRRLIIRRGYSSSASSPSPVTPQPPSAPKPTPFQQQQHQSSSSSSSSGGSRVLPTTLFVLGATGAGIAGYYYYDPNAEVFKTVKGLLGIAEEEKKVVEKKPIVKPKSLGSVSTSAPNYPVSSLSSSLKDEVPPVPIPKPMMSAPPASKKPVSSAPASSTVAAPAISSVPPLPSLSNNKASPATSSATSDSSNKFDEEKMRDSPNYVPKHVLITALRAQQEALSESNEAKLETVKMEYDRKLNNAAQIMEAERVVELRAKYEKASAALGAIEKGIEARTTQNERAKRLRSLWAQVNALHNRVNHPEYHSSNITKIDKPSLLRAVQAVPDKFVAQMVASLPSGNVHSLESLKERFYADVEPVARSVGLIKEGEGFSLWKYVCGKLGTGVIAAVVRTGTPVEMQGTQKKSDSSSNSPIRSTAQALECAKASLDKGDLLTAAIAVNHLQGLPRQVASDWLADARMLLETNQTLFVLMTYAASNNVF